MDESKWYDENKWLIATLGAALCWAVADIFCDMCIGEEDDDDEFGFEMVPIGTSAEKMTNKSSADNLPALASQSEASIKRRTNSQSMETTNDTNLRMRNGDNVLNSARNRNSSQKFKVGDLENSSSDMISSGDSSGMIKPSSSSESLDLKNRKGRTGSIDIGVDPSESSMMIKKDEDLEIDDKSHNNGKEDEEDEEEHLDGIQDCAVAGITTGSIMYLLSLKRVHLAKQASHLASNVLERDSVHSYLQPQFIWSPGDDLEWWLATLSGILMFSHYFYLLQAYDNAPSTVINPLIQVSSTWMLVGSAVPAALTGSTFIRPFDFLCYIIIVVGGILPSLDGDMKRMLRLSFWKQSYVRNIIISEFAVGIYDLVMSYSLKSSAKKEKFRGILPADLEFEFFFIAWCGFAVVFCLVYGTVPNLRQRFIDLQNIPRRVIFFSSLGQVLTLFGYYLSQFAYSWYYQASIVHAAEASLSQGLNLLFALGALKIFGVGRESAISNLRVKVLSCVIVSLGLFLLTISESEDEDALILHDMEHPDPMTLVGTEQQITDYEGIKSAAENIIGSAAVADIVTAVVNRPRTRKSPSRRRKTLP